MEDRLWSTAEVAEYLGVPVSTIYIWRNRGEGGPKAIRIGKYLRFRREDVDAWVAERAKESA